MSSTCSVAIARMSRPEISSVFIFVISWLFSLMSCITPKLKALELYNETCYCFCNDLINELSISLHTNVPFDSCVEILLHKTRVISHLCLFSNIVYEYHKCVGHPWPMDTSLVALCTSCFCILWLKYEMYCRYKLECQVLLLPTVVDIFYAILKMNMLTWWCCSYYKRLYM